MTILPDLVRRTETDHLVHRIADLHLDRIPLADNADISAAKLAQQIERRLRLLAQRQPQAVLLAALADSLVDVP